MGPDSPTQANLPIQTCFTFWIRPPSWGRNTTNDDDGNDDDAHTHTLTTTKSEGGGASGGPPCPLGAVLSPPRRPIPKGGSAESRHEKTKKDHSFPLFKVQHFPTGYPGPLEVLCTLLPLVQKKQKRISVTCPFALQADPSRTPNPPSGSRDHSVNLQEVISAENLGSVC